VGVCRGCGSINTRELRGSLLSRIVRQLVRRRRVVCQRCGWQGRVVAVRAPRRGASWRSGDAAAVNDGAAGEPNLSAVDAALQTEDRRRPDFGESVDASRGTC
jgi:hypothetical protein